LVLLSVVDGGDALQHSVGVELGSDVAILQHEALADLVNLGIFEWSNLKLNELFFK
jgi:hypothetical protein